MQYSANWTLCDKCDLINPAFKSVINYVFNYAIAEDGLYIAFLTNTGSSRCNLFDVTIKFCISHLLGLCKKPMSVRMMSVCPPAQYCTRANSVAVSSTTMLSKKISIQSGQK